MSFLGKNMMLNEGGNILMREKYSLQDRIFMERMAEEAAARHRTPVAEFDHPKGVIVPGDQLLTDNIREDRNYVPYCGPCMPMQRMRRTADGFICPTCRKRTNWDLTAFNHNVDVQFDPEYVDPEWLAEHQRNVEAIKNHEALHKETYTEFKTREAEQQRRDWYEDKGKKNTSTHKCNKCTSAFFGKNSRKYCRPCQDTVNQQIKQNAYINSPYQRTKAERVRNQGKRMY